MITSKQVPVVKVSDNKKRRKTVLLILGMVVSVLVVAMGIVFIIMLASGYYGTNNDSYKQTICTAKAIDFAQKGIIRDIGGFNGAIYECTHMNYRNSIYGDVPSAVEHRGVLA